MIKNDEQLKRTVEWIDKLTNEMESLSYCPRPHNIHPAVWEASIKAYDYQIDELEKQVREYLDTTTY